MINFENFVIGLKVKLIYKILDSQFAHPWKSIIINQLKKPDQPIVSIEVGATKMSRNFTIDLVNSFIKWKQKVSLCRNKTINFCLWGGGIPGAGQGSMWNEYLISRNIIYAKDFVDDNGELYDYNGFRYRHNVRLEDLTKSEFASLRLALRRFDTPGDMKKSLANIDPCINLSIFLGDRNGTLVHTDTKTIREMLIISQNFEFLSQPQFHKWSTDIPELQNEVTWQNIFTNMYKISNHNRLVQHQYKILTLIATSKYMRFKMKIENDHQCLKCPPGTSETLKHIYLECPANQAFMQKLSEFIVGHLEEESPNSNINQFALNHENAAVNFLYLAANWYVGRKTQKCKDLFWDEFLKHLKILLDGEKTAIVNRLVNKL